MADKAFTIELDVNDMATANIYMRMTREELATLARGIQGILELPHDVEDHDFYRLSTIDDYEGDKVTVTVGLHKWQEVRDEAD